MWWNKIRPKKSEKKPDYMKTAEQRLNSSSRAVEELIREASARISEFQDTHTRVVEFANKEEETNAVREKKA